MAKQAAGPRPGYFLGSVCSYPSVSLVLEDLVVTTGPDHKPGWCRDLGWEDGDFIGETKGVYIMAIPPPPPWSPGLFSRGAVS